MHQLMVLADGETFSRLDGCKIISVPDFYTTKQVKEALEESEHSNRFVTVPKVQVLTVFRGK